MHHILRAVLLLTVIYMTGCGTRVPYYSFEKRNWEENSPPDSVRISESVILVGDTGAPDLDGEDPFLELLNAHLQNEQDEEDKATLVFLGDNIYEIGLPATDHPNYEVARDRLEKQLEIVKAYPGSSFFVPGNHDWNNSREGGYRSILRQQQYINEYLDTTNVLLPRNGCPGPEEVNLGDGVVLILIDTEWYLHDHRKPYYPDCTIESEWDFFYEFSRIVKRNEGKHILIASHHPLYSNGNHGGHYSLGDHIFPLTLVKPNFWLPLPVIGSFYTLLRKYGISEQDIANTKYQMLKKGLEESVYGLKSVTFAAGHDHILQHTTVNDINHLISGSGSKVNYARKGKEASFVHSSTGLARLTYYENGEAWVSFYVPDKEEPMGKLVYRVPLYALSPEESPLAKKTVEELDYSDSVKQIIAGEEYRNSFLSKVFFGSHYRQEWITPVEAQYLDIPNFNGGLTPLKQGGGKQTISLRMMDGDSIQYNIRSINKNPIGVVPEPFRFTFAQDLVKDQISTAHPYGAFTVAPMADALDLYHTNPRLVYVPFAPQLGEFLGTFGGMPALFEIRPDEDLSNYERFGYSNNVVSTGKMLEQLNEDNDDSVDDRMFLKARLFDMLIGDWDRHEDQWRWAEYDKEDKGEFFRPIPRDRDQVYTKYDGIFPWLATRKWAVRELQHFERDFRDVEGLMKSGNTLDRRILQQLSREDWQEVAEEVKLKLNDSLIADAIRMMPKEVYPLSGEEIVDKLIARKNALPAAAMEYYTFLAEEPDVVASEKHELIRISGGDDQALRIEMLKREKEGDLEHKFFDRTYSPGETSEIRLYTLDGEDSILIADNLDSPIRLRIILGEDNKYLENNAENGNIVLYARTPHEHVIKGRENLSLHESKHEFINDYRPELYEYEYVGPQLSVQFNRDNGLFLGAGVLWRTYGFNHEDFSTEQSVSGNYSFATQAFNLKYDGRFADFFGHDNDLLVASHYYSPQNILNFFGRGNGTENTESIDYYRLRLKGFTQDISFENAPSDNFQLGATLGYQYVEFTQKDEEILNAYPFVDELQPGHFLSLGAYLNLQRTNYDLYPFNGVRWLTRAKISRELKTSSVFGKVSSDFSVYLTPELPFYITIAMRFGTEATFGEFPFYQGSYLGGTSNLRGFRMQRFNGDISVYQNTELRLAISEINSYIFNGYWGVFGFIDHGRVWTREVGNESKEWHQGYGPGVWLNLFKIFVTSAGLGFSEEGKYFYLRAGMFF